MTRRQTIDSEKSAAKFKIKEVIMNSKEAFSLRQKKAHLREIMVDLLKKNKQD